MTLYDIRMRTIVDIPREQLDALAVVCRCLNISRAEAVRKALDEYLAKLREAEPNEVFGLWKNHGVDARAHEDSLRDEWEQR